MKWQVGVKGDWGGGGVNTVNKKGKLVTLTNFY